MLQFSRRGHAAARVLKAVGAAGAVVALALTAGSCNAPDMGLDRQNLILDIGNSAEPISLDPQRVNGQWENNIIGNMFMGLTTEDEQGNPIPGMATSWTVSPDGLVWTFALRDANWSDGVPVTAADFVTAYRRLLAGDSVAEYATIQYVIKNAEAVHTKGADINTLGVRAIDSKTLELTLEHPAPYLPGLLKHYTAYPIPTHVFREHGDDWIRPENVVVNGPYTLVRWMSNHLVHLKKNPAFWDASNVCFRDLYFYPTNDADAAIARIRNGELAWNTIFPGQKRDQLNRDLPGWVRGDVYMLTNYLSFNMQIAPFNDVRVRRAFAMVMDRDFVVDKVLRSGETVAYAMVPPQMNAYPKGPRPEWADWSREKRLAEAKTLLETAGYGPAKPLKVLFRHRNSGENPRIAPVFQNDWNSIAPWVQVELQGTETQIHYADMRADKHQVGDGGWIADFNDAQNFLYLMQSNAGPQNYANYANPEYDALMEAANNERDAEKRYQMMYRAEEMIVRDVPIAPIYYGTSKQLVNPDITGFSTNLEDVHRVRWMCVKGAAPPFR
jgi:oligopeptide transport system substrate-binding protein